MRVFPEYEGPIGSWPRVELLPGVAECLNTLPDEIVLCVATNAGDANAQRLADALERVGIRDYFSHLLTGDELGFQKPDSRFFLQVVSCLGLQPEECVSIGDNCGSDIRPASKIGLKTVWLRSAAISARCPYADFSLVSPAELPAILAHIQRPAR
jgi:putative hydrolase of the HAD superfamily